MFFRQELVMWARLVFGKQDRDCHLELDRLEEGEGDDDDDGDGDGDGHLELDRLEEDEEGRAGVVLHVVVQTKRLQAKHRWRECWVEKRRRKQNDFVTKLIVTVLR